MIRVFLLLLACVASTWYLADSIKQKGPGYVYVYYDQYSMETSFWFFLLLMTGLVAGLFILVKAISLLLYYLVKIGYLPKFFLMGRARKFRYQGHLAFLNQQWKLSAKKMGKAAKNSETPFLDYLMAARAYLAVNDIPSATSNAGMAKNTSDYDAESHAMLLMDITIAQGDAFRQQQSIKALLDENPGKPAVLMRAIKIYREQKQWLALQLLLPAIKKHHVLAEADYSDLLAAVATGLMPAFIHAAQIKELKSLWKSVAKVHDRDDVVKAYCEALARMNEAGEARKLLEMHLQRRWSDRLIMAYAALPVTDKLRQLDFAETFLPFHSHNPALLVALGCIAKNNGYLAKAKDYLYKSMQVLPSVKACELMADIADIQQDPALAQDYLRQALALAQA